MKQNGISTHHIVRSRTSSRSVFTPIITVKRHSNVFNDETAEELIWFAEAVGMNIIRSPLVLGEEGPLDCNVHIISTNRISSTPPNGCFCFAGSVHGRSVGGWAELLSKLDMFSSKWSRLNLF